MVARVSSVLALLAQLVALPATANPYELRNPQIPVSGSGLQDYFNSAGESIDVQQDQVDAELMQMYLWEGSLFTLTLEIGRWDPGLILGLYDGSALNSWRVEVFPSSARPGWSAVVTFHEDPVRVVVKLFDLGATLISSHTVLGGNRAAIGFYVQGMAGRYYSQDFRNPDGAAHVLFYGGTWAYSGSVWIAFEAAAGELGADGDFDDAVLFLERNQFVGPVEHTSWGKLKERFR